MAPRKGKGEAEADEGGGSEIAVIFPKNSVVTELAKAKRNAKKRASAIAGEIGQQIQKAADEKHLDRKAFAMVCSLDALDDERLAITLPHLQHYIELLGLDKRAGVQPSLLPTDKNGRVVDPAEGSDGKVTPIGRAARRVAEAAGEATQG